MTGVKNSKLIVEFDLTTGITLTRIFDVVARRDYLPQPSMFFEFSANNGPVAFQSNLGIQASLEDEAGDGSGFSILARSNDDLLGFELTAGLERDSVAAWFQLTVINLTAESIFLRVVLPKIFGVRTPGDPADMFGMVSKEGGCVAPLSEAHNWGTPSVPLGMRFIVDVGLPNSHNNMEVASIFDRCTGGGVFFCDMDGDLDNGVAPLQFNLSSNEVDAFWIGDIPVRGKIKLPRLAIGVHAEGDWHKAVDYYTFVHRPRWTFPDTPSWFRDAGAIYSPAGGGAGGIYLAHAPALLPAGTIWDASDGGSNEWSIPAVQITPGGFSPGSFLQAIKQNPQQVTVFAAGYDGAIWATWETNDGPWHNNRNGLLPARITPSGWVSPDCPFACAQQGENQWDVFFTRPDGSIWVTWELGDGAWTDGQEGRESPAQIASPGLVPGGAHLVATAQNGTLHLFSIGNDGAIWLWSVVGDGHWSEGIPITSPNWFPKGAPLVSAVQNDLQLNVFAVDQWGTVRTTLLISGSPQHGDPVQFSPLGVAPKGAFVAAAKQSDSQLDVFFVGNDGAVTVTWEQNDGFRTDGNLGRMPARITPIHYAKAGVPLAVVAQNNAPEPQSADELQVFVTGVNGAVSVTFEQNDSAWTDGEAGRPAPRQINGPPAIPSSGIAAIARNSTQVDVFFTPAGRIKSFLELPSLLAEANALGTNVLYLVDYWEGSDQGQPLPYMNKGDYIPRSDLGGDEAFTEGINLVHQQNGRVLLYLEPFIIYQYSAIGQAKDPVTGQATGLVWGGQNDNGKLWGIDLWDSIYPNYQYNYTMVAPFSPWQDFVVQTAERLIGQYGADGIMLDSYAWQMNRPMHVDLGIADLSYTAYGYSQGVLELVRRVRSAVQRIKPDAVVIGETTAGPVARCWDGGLNADLGFGNVWGPAQRLQDQTASPIPQRLVASPVRYGIPEVRMFGNGLNLGGLHQIFAAGHSLALCSNFDGGGFMFENATHVRRLVSIRTTYKDALIYGSQINQPGTDNPNVVAYQYQGSTHRILTIVNISDDNATANIRLDTPDPGGIWKDLLNRRSYHTNSSGVFENVTLETGQGSLLILLHTVFSPTNPKSV